MLAKKPQQYVVQHVARAPQQDVKVYAKQLRKPIVDELHPPLPLPVLYTLPHPPNHFAIVVQNVLSQGRHRLHDRAEAPQRPTAMGDIQSMRWAFAHVATAAAQGNMLLHLLVIAADEC